MSGSDLSDFLEITDVGDRKRVELTNGGESRNLEASKSGVYIVSECYMIT